MTTIEQLIGDLLLQHNCVIVPSFGGFVAKQSSARIDYVSGKMFPPSKSLLFNKQLINNDGLLVNELSQARGISFDESSRSVSTKVSEWNTILAEGGRIELDRIGILYQDAENNLCFEQDRFFNLLLESFGLEQIQFLTEEDVKIAEAKVTLSQPERTEVIIPVGNPEKVGEKEEIKVVEHPVLTKNKRQVWKYIAAACLLPIAFYSFWIPMKTDVLESGVLSMRDFNPFHNVHESSYKKVPHEEAKLLVEEGVGLQEMVEELPTGVDVYTYKFSDDLFIPVKLPSENTETLEDPIEGDSENAAFNAQTIHYIVGCFGDESNATNLVLKLKEAGFDASIVDVKNGLHRVSAGGAISIESFNKIKMAALNLGFKGWTLK